MLNAGLSQQEVHASDSACPFRLRIRWEWDLIQPAMPNVGDQVPVGLGDGVELRLLDRLVQAGVQCV